MPVSKRRLDLTRLNRAFVIIAEHFNVSEEDIHKVLLNGFNICQTQQHPEEPYLCRSSSPQTPLIRRAKVDRSSSPQRQACKRDRSSSTTRGRSRLPERSSSSLEVRGFCLQPPPRRNSMPEGLRSHRREGSQCRMERLSAEREDSVPRGKTMSMPDGLSAGGTQREVNAEREVVTTTEMEDNVCIHRRDEIQPSPASLSRRSPSKLVAPMPAKYWSELHAAFGKPEASPSKADPKADADRPETATTTASILTSRPGSSSTATDSQQAWHPDPTSPRKRPDTSESAASTELFQTWLSTLEEARAGSKTSSCWSELHASFAPTEPQSSSLSAPDLKQAPEPTSSASNQIQHYRQRYTGSDIIITSTRSIPDPEPTSPVRSGSLAAADLKQAPKPSSPALNRIQHYRQRYTGDNIIITSTSVLPNPDQARDPTSPRSPSIHASLRNAGDPHPKCNPEAMDPVAAQCVVAGGSESTRRSEESNQTMRDGKSIFQKPSSSPMFSMHCPRTIQQHRASCAVKPLDSSLSLGETPRGRVVAKSSKATVTSTLEEVFKSSCGSCDVVGCGLVYSMDCKAFVKLCKRSSLRRQEENKNLTSRDFRLIFSGAVPLDKQRMDFQYFQIALQSIAARTGLDEKAVRQLVAQSHAPAAEPDPNEILEAPVSPKERCFPKLRKSRSNTSFDCPRKEDNCGKRSLSVDASSSDKDGTQDESSETSTHSSDDHTPVVAASRSLPSTPSTGTRRPGWQWSGLLGSERERPQSQPCIKQCRLQQQYHAASVQEAKLYGSSAALDDHVSHQHNRSAAKCWPSMPLTQVHSRNQPILGIDTPQSDEGQRSSSPAIHEDSQPVDSGSSTPQRRIWSSMPVTHLLAHTGR